MLNKIIPIRKNKPYILSKKDAEVFAQMDAQPMVEVSVTPNECTDYVIDPVTGALTSNVRSVTVNNQAYHLKPGINMVPLFIRDVLEESRDLQRNATNCVVEKGGFRTVKTNFNEHVNRAQISDIARLAEQARSTQEKKES